MEQTSHHELMVKAIEKARETMNENIGGPFGALIVDRHGEVLAVTSNSVLRDHDPTAHAEMNAIRMACKTLGTYDLSGCTLYTTAYPCPMCLSAIIWANIKKVYYGATENDSDGIGFRDEFIYTFIEGNRSDKNILDLEEVERDECLTLFREYTAKDKELY